MNWIKISFINLIVLISLLIIIELGLRFVWTGYKCFKGTCDFSRISKIQVGQLMEISDITEYDPHLGYVVKAGVSVKMKNSRNESTLTTDRYGFRMNFVEKVSSDYISNKKILAVGDSFAFGAEVENDQTWPACIEKRTKQQILNGGIFGYGAAQSVLRASNIIQNHEIDTLMLGILIHNNFNRDQLKFRNGYPRPAVINLDGELNYAMVPSYSSVGTRYNPRKKNELLKTIRNNSFLVAKIIYTLKIDFSGMMRYEMHPDAATIDEIIEFTISELEKININKKIIILHYIEGDFNQADQAKKTQYIRDQVYKHIAQKDILIIDTYPMLNESYKKGNKAIWWGQAEKDMWWGHHTPYGNELVCNEIINNLAH